jgi:hypothetical protein
MDMNQKPVLKTAAQSSSPPLTFFCPEDGEELLALRLALRAGMTTVLVHNSAPAVANVITGYAPHSPLSASLSQPPPTFTVHTELKIAPVKLDVVSRLFLFWLPLPLKCHFLQNCLSHQLQ